VSSSKPQTFLFSKKDHVHAVRIIEELAVITFLVFLLIELKKHVWLILGFAKFHEVIDVSIALEHRWVDEFTQLTFEILPE